MLAPAGPSQASSPVKVLVAGLYGRCPCLSAGFTGPARRAHGHMTDRTGREGRNQLENRRSGGMWPLRAKRSVKPSAQPTLVRTQHLPHKTPGQAGSGCSRLPGLRRVRGRSGRPFPVVVGQIWPGQRLVRAGFPGRSARRLRSAEPVSPGYRFRRSQCMSPDLAGAGGSSCVPLGPAVARTPDGQDQAGFTLDSWASRGPIAG